MTCRKKVRRAGAWPNLPSEILSTIGKLVESNIDVLRCRSVCKNWRTHINPNPSILSPFLPHKVSNSTLPFNKRPNEPLILFARAAFLVKPLPSSKYSSPWVLTVEEVVCGKLRILYPLSKDHVSSLPSNFPKSLNLLDYSVSEISKTYGFKYASDKEDVVGVHVVLSSDFTAMVLYGEGTLIGVRLKTGNWGFVRDSLVNSFADVIAFKGLTCAIDSKGNLHSIDHETMKVIKTVVVSLPAPPIWTRKRLVEHKGTLWLVAWPCVDKKVSLDNAHFRVYRLYSSNGRVSMKLSLEGWSLFVTLHWCFIVRGNDLNVCEFVPKKEQAMNPFSSVVKPGNQFHWSLVRGDYLVYSLACFEPVGEPPLQNSHLLFEEASVHLPIGVFYFRKEDSYKRQSLCATLAGVLWPPPTWFLPDTYTCSGDNEVNEGSGCWYVDDSTDIKEELPDLPPSSIFAPSVGDASNSTQVAPNNTEISLFKAPGDSHHVLKIQDFNTCALTEKFEGLMIKSNLVPTLQNIWAKHGNIFEGSTIRSGDLIARALESLAIAVLILQSNSGQSLNEIQAEYLSSTMADLRSMHFKVDWLITYVEMALAIYKSKPLFDALKKYDEAKAKAEEMKRKVLDEVAKLDEVEEDLKSVFEIMPSLGSVDLNQILGEGIC